MSWLLWQRGIWTMINNKRQKNKHSASESRQEPYCCPWIAQLYASKIQIPTDAPLHMDFCLMAFNSLKIINILRIYHLCRKAVSFRVHSLNRISSYCNINTLTKLFPCQWLLNTQDYRGFMQKDKFKHLYLNVSLQKCVKEVWWNNRWVQ